MFPRRAKKKAPEGPEPPSIEDLLDRMDGYLGQTREVLAQAKSILATESTEP